MMFRVHAVSGAILVMAALSMPNAEAQDRNRALLLLDRTHLAGVVERARRGDPGLKASIAALEEDARKGLKFAPVSVMDKTITPPSGDKHDYMSQAPYWWPDPSKPNGRPYIRKDGERNPEINRLPDHDNLGRVASTVSTLGLAYHLTGRDEYASHAAKLVRVWFLDPAARMNPHLQFGQGIPGINEGRGIGIIETRGLPEMLDGVMLLSRAPAWTLADDNSLHAWMTAYLRWLTTSQYGQDEGKNGNNHETWYDVQVAGLALYTGQADLARRTLEGARARIARQIEPDGRQPRELERTRSWDYSIFNLRAFFDLATMSDRVNLDLWSYQTPDGRGLRKALDFLVPFAAGDRRWPEAQITAFETGALHPLLRRAAVAWKEPKYRELAVKAGGGSPRLDLTVR
jgi:alginate lyase